MDSLFLFDNKENAMEFKTQFRDSNYQLVNVNLLGGSTQSFDMNWFTNVPCDIPLSEVKEYAKTNIFQEENITLAAAMEKNANK